MTIKLGELEDRSIVGKNTRLRVVGIAIGEKNAAVRVKTEDIESEKDLPHITIAVDTALGGSPKDSDELTNWKTIGRPFYVTGRVEEVIEQF